MQEQYHVIEPPLVSVKTLGWSPPQNCRDGDLLCHQFSIMLSLRR